MAPLLRGKRALAPDLPLLERLAVLRSVPAGGVAVNRRLKKIPFQCSRATFVALKDAWFSKSLMATMFSGIQVSESNSSQIVVNFNSLLIRFQ